jgi:hypothetical protein
VTASPADMFVYRDSGDDADYPTPPPAADQEEADYWYGPPPTAEPEPALAEEVRGPFEPIISSADHHAPVPEESEPEPVAEADPADVHAQKLEQIKDFYLTAEAIGEQNVDKHFDQLLAQQRELISEYFKQSDVHGRIAGTDSAGGQGAAEDGESADVLLE